MLASTVPVAMRIGGAKANEGWLAGFKPTGIVDFVWEETLHEHQLALF